MGHHFGIQNPYQFQPPFQHQFGMGMPPPGCGSSRGRGIPSFFPNWGGIGPPSGLGTPFRQPGPPVPTPPISTRPSSAPPGNQSEMVRVFLKFTKFAISFFRIYFL